MFLFAIWSVSHGNTSVHVSQWPSGRVSLAQITGVDTWRSDLQVASITYAMLNSVPVICVTCASKFWLPHVAHDHWKRQYDSRRHVAVATTPNLRLLVVIGRTYGNRQPLGLHIEISFLSVLTFSRSVLSACLCILAQPSQLLAPFVSPAVSVSALPAQAPQAASAEKRWASSWLLLRLRANSSTPAVC